MRVVGRVKEKINRGGEKVEEEEIEKIIIINKDVKKEEIVEMKDELMGEKRWDLIV